MLISQCNFDEAHGPPKDHCSRGHCPPCPPFGDPIRAQHKWAVKVVRAHAPEKFSKITLKLRIFVHSGSKF